jgi:arsenate reductase-like glutaredoxin family protein
MTCIRAQEFLARNHIQASTTVDARKTPMDRGAALELAKQVDQIFTSKGAQTHHLDLRKGNPGDDVIATLLLGPTGNLRAPTLRRGRTLVVGFNEETYEKVLL